jgi:hypothetical protein
VNVSASCTVWVDSNIPRRWPVDGGRIRRDDDVSISSQILSSSREKEIKLLTHCDD